MKHFLNKEQKSFEYYLNNKIWLKCEKKILKWNKHKIKKNLCKAKGCLQFLKLNKIYHHIEPAVWFKFCDGSYRRDKAFGWAKYWDVIWHITIYVVVSTNNHYNKSEVL